MSLGCSNDVYNALRASVLGGSFAEGLTACTEFIYTPKLGSSEENVAIFDRMFPRADIPEREKGETGDVVAVPYRRLPDLTNGWLPVAVRGLKPREGDSNVYISGPHVSTDDAERTFECLALLKDNGFFEHATDEDIRRAWFKSMHDWAVDSVYCGFMTIDAFREPESYERYLEVMAEPKFKGHFSLSLGPLMQAGPFCLCVDSRPIELVCAMSNAHPIAVQSARFHYHVNRSLFLRRLALGSSEDRIGADEIRTAIANARGHIDNPQVLRAIDAALGGDTSILMEKSVEVTHPETGETRTMGLESLHAVFSFVYVLLNARSFGHGVGVGLELSYQNYNFDTDTIGQIAGWLLAHVFGLRGVVDTFGAEAVENWERFDPSDQEKYDDQVAEIKRALLGDGDVTDIVAISEPHLKGIRDGSFKPVAHVRPAKFTQKCVYATIMHVSNGL